MYIPLEERILAITGGKCRYNTSKKCDGLCNSCAIQHELSVAEEKKTGRYFPTFASATGGNSNNYEEVILERQEENQ